VRDLAERSSLRPALLLGTLQVRSPGDVLGDELRGGYMGGAFIVGALGNPSAMTPPLARVRVTFEPGAADAAFDLPAMVQELRLEERLAAVLADDEGGCGIRCWQRGSSCVRLVGW
jgi:hypothetical protein